MAKPSAFELMEQLNVCLASNEDGRNWIVFAVFGLIIVVMLDIVIRTLKEDNSSG